MKRFKIGDRVRVKKTFDGKDLAGKTGTIVCEASGIFKKYKWGVKFDERINGHTCMGACEDGYGRYGCEKELELVTRCENKIVITSDGVTTLARLYDGKKVIKSAEAKCSPDDEFDFAKGAKLAYARLMGEEAETEYRFKAGDKVKIIKNTCCHGYSIGRIVTLKEHHEYCDPKAQVPSWCVCEGGWFVDEADIELSKEPIYKAGDRVVVTGNTCWHKYRIGERLTLKEAREPDGREQRWDVEEGCWYVRENDFEPLGK